MDIVQAAGRALRPYPGKQYGYILLPLVVPPGMEVKDFAETTEFKQVARTITALSTQDERIAEQFRVVEHGRRPTGKIVEFEGDVPVGLPLDIDAFAEQIGTKIWARVGTANWRPFLDARSFVRSLRLASKRHWIEFTQSGRLPPDIPANPNTVFRSDGWISMGDWLGTGAVASSKREFWPFHLAREFARSLKLTGVNDWYKFRDSGAAPLELPSNPQLAYGDSGWNGWGDWLGTGNVANFNKEFLPFEEARTYARSLRLTSGEQWKQFWRTARPSNLPAAPIQINRMQLARFLRLITVS